MTAPAGYSRLPPNFAPCRCVKAWREADGSMWCCKPPPLPFWYWPAQRLKAGARIGASWCLSYLWIIPLYKMSGKFMSQNLFQKVCWRLANAGHDFHNSHFDDES